MSFNFSKCKVMHVGRKNPKYEYGTYFTRGINFTPLKYLWIRCGRNVCCFSFSSFTLCFAALISEAVFCSCCRKTHIKLIFNQKHFSFCLCSLLPVFIAIRDLLHFLSGSLTFLTSLISYVFSHRLLLRE